jgi:hypothetical protein
VAADHISAWRSCEKPSAALNKIRRIYGSNIIMRANAQTARSENMKNAFSGMAAAKASAWCASMLEDARRASRRSALAASRRRRRKTMASGGTKIDISRRHHHGGVAAKKKRRHRGADGIAHLRAQVTSNGNISAAVAAA